LEDTRENEEENEESSKASFILRELTLVGSLEDQAAYVRGRGIQEIGHCLCSGLGGVRG
jgi:hypothetical protein